MNKLEDAIEDFYRAFVDITAPDYIEACPCCLKADEVGKLLSTPLRELAPDDLGHYAAAAFLTAGDVSDYLYFLPRIIDISIHDDFWWPSIEVTARAIYTSGLSSWPASPSEALTSLLTAFIKHVIETEQHSRLDGWICAIGRMELDVRPISGSLRAIQMLSWSFGKTIPGN